MGIFARELKAVLEAHEGQYPVPLGRQGARSDPVWYPLRRLRVPSAQIQRLKRAAASDTLVSTLCPATLAVLAATLRFTDEEQHRLRAALVAQGIELFLREREPSDARAVVSQATEGIFRSLARVPSAILRDIR